MKKEVLGKKAILYYAHAYRNMKVMVPLDSVEQVGLRKVVGMEDIETVKSILKENTEMSSNWNRRYRANMEKIKSGNIFEVAEVKEFASP